MIGEINIYSVWKYEHCVVISELIYKIWTLHIVKCWQSSSPLVIWSFSLSLIFERVYYSLHQWLYESLGITTYFFANFNSCIFWGRLTTVKMLIIALPSPKVLHILIFTLGFHQKVSFPIVVPFTHLWYLEIFSKIILEFMYIAKWLDFKSDYNNKPNFTIQIIYKRCISFWNILRFWVRS